MKPTCVLPLCFLVKQLILETFQTSFLYHSMFHSYIIQSLQTKISKYTTAIIAICKQHLLTGHNGVCYLLYSPFPFFLVGERSFRVATVRSRILFRWKVIKCHIIHACSRQVATKQLILQTVQQ